MSARRSELLTERANIYAEKVKVTENYLAVSEEHGPGSHCPKI